MDRGTEEETEWYIVMRFFLIFLVFFFTFVSTNFAQESYQYANEEEIPLDDFPGRLKGFRVQWGVYSSEKWALAALDSLKNQLNEKVHLHYENGLWKVRIGDFNDSLKAVSYRDSALVPCGVVAEVIADALLVPINCANETLEQIEGYRIQLEALSNREQALEKARKLNLNHPEIRSYVIKQDGWYKIRMGDFQKRREAESWLAKIVEEQACEPLIIQSLIYLNPPPAPIERTVSDPLEYIEE